MTLRYIGEDGFMGLKHGQIYDCRLNTNSSDDLIWLHWKGGACLYTSLTNLINSWEDA